ncbi:S-adenosyl-L-methionine-dependent methyltransferase [Trichophaea hybrida]|nr:S-adenosyl-L-methionine-dependent methyltransferase [Trichophaea hybrida]
MTSPPAAFPAEVTSTSTSKDPAAHYGSDIEIDPAMNDNSDSDYASSGYETSTESLSSSIHEYIFENGRRYHTYYGANKSIIPADELEKDRLDITHEIFRLTLDGKLHRAPLKDPHRILDVGTGTGIWAIDMADEYPQAEVIGIDLTPIQPAWLPPNCRFELDDADREWTYKPGSFDFIHFRNVGQGIQDWPKALSEAYRCMQPGAFIEIADSGAMVYSDDGTLSDVCKHYFDLLNVAMNKINRLPMQAGLQKDRLEKAGFVDIDAVAIKEPWGPWAKEKRLKRIGLMNLLQSQTAFHAYGYAAFTRILGMDSEEADKLCHDAYQSTLSKNSHMYYFHYVAYGRKPRKEELEV